MGAKPPSTGKMKNTFSPPRHKDTKGKAKNKIMFYLGALVVKKKKRILTTKARRHKVKR